MDLISALRSLRRGWFLVVLGLMIGLGAAVVLHRSTPVQYTSEGTYLVVPSADDPEITANINSLDSTRSRTVLTTLTEIMMSDTVKADAGAALGFDPLALEKIDVAAATLPEANGVTLSVTSADPATSQALADAIAAASGTRFDAVYRIYVFTSLDPPDLPESPSTRSLVELAAIGAALGLALGGTAALVRGPGAPASARRRRRGMATRLDAYGSNVTPLYDRDRYQRTG